MKIVPKFFVPHATPDTQETIYAVLAHRAQRPVPEPSERIYSITYEHNGETWTSSVGLPSQGLRTPRQGREIRLGNRAITLAIFPGNPYVIVTDDTRTSWTNPHLIGESSIKGVVKFTLD